MRDNKQKTTDLVFPRQELDDSDTVEKFREKLDPRICDLLNGIETFKEKGDNDALEYID